MSRQKIGTQLVLLVHRVVIHDVFSRAAKTAFYLMLSLFPLLLFLVSVLNQAQISLDMDSLTLFLPRDMAALVLEIGKLAPSQGNWPLLSALASTWSASAGVWALMLGTYQAYRQDKMKSPIRYRLLALLITFGFAVAIAVSLALSIFGTYLADFITFQLGTESFVLSTPIRRLVTLGFIFLFLTLFYTVTPGNGKGIKRHMPGALTAAAGWIVSSWGYEIYMTNFSNFTVIYGSIGAFWGFMIWVFLLSVIVLIGAEINAFRIAKCC